VAEEQSRPGAGERDRAATRRDVDAGIRDRMAGDEMTDGERDARADAARDRMAAMRDRQDAARERGAGGRDRDGAPDDGDRRDGDDA
jgi:hypothetical protein